MTGGQVNGTRVSFVAAGCDYDGGASGNPTNRISGTLSCRLDVSGQTLILSGEWTGTR